MGDFEWTRDPYLLIPFLTARGASPTAIIKITKYKGVDKFNITQDDSNLTPKIPIIMCDTTTFIPKDVAHYTDKVNISGIALTYNTGLVKSYEAYKK